MRFRFKNLLAAALLLGLALAGSAELSARDRSPGRPLFESAYAAEQDDPEQALDMYERALKKGLGRELRKAARWRLFYLYRKAGRYGEALSMAARLGSDKKLRNVLGGLYDEIAVRYSVSREAAREYATGLKLLALDRHEQAALRFEKSLQLSKSSPKGNAALRTAITNRLMRRGDSRTALAVLRQEGEQNRKGARLARADLLVKLKRDTEARKLLAQIAANPATAKWSHADQSQVFYLLARISRRAKQAAATVRWFRLAAVHAKFARDAELQSRMQSLAAYELVSRGHVRAARGLMLGLPASKDRNVRLLDLMLKAHVDGNEASRKQLRDLLAEQPDGHKKSRLAELAATVAAGRPLIIKTQENGVPGFPFAAPLSKAELLEIEARVKAEQAAGKEPSIRVPPQAYWQNRFARDTSSELVLEVPQKFELVLFRSDAELQMHGASRNSMRSSVKLSKPLRIPRRLKQLDGLLRDARGHYTVLALPEREAAETAAETQQAEDAEQTQAESAAKSEKAESARIRRDQIVDARFVKPAGLESAADEDWLLIHLYSNGKGWVFVELEEDAGRTRMPEYRHGWIPAERLRVVYD